MWNFAWVLEDFLYVELQGQSFRLLCLMCFNCSIYSFLSGLPAILEQSLFFWWHQKVVRVCLWYLKRKKGPIFYNLIIFFKSIVPRKLVRRENYPWPSKVQNAQKAALKILKVIFKRRKFPIYLNRLLASFTSMKRTAILNPHNLPHPSLSRIRVASISFSYMTEESQKYFVSLVYSILTFIKITIKTL